MRRFLRLTDFRTQSNWTVRCPLSYARLVYMVSRKGKASDAGDAEHLCECGAAVPAHLRDCPVCGRDNGCPNLRAAELKTEIEALDARLHAAEVSAEARNCLDILNQFGVAVLGSKAVVARSLGVLDDIVMSDNVVWVSYHQQVASGSRMPENNKWDRGRTAAESTILPNFHDRISYAALSLDGRGVTAFGPYSIVLREGATALRASVFEENSFLFHQRHKVIAGQPPPPGYRATWSQRHILAKSKLQHLLTASTTPARFAGILITQASRAESADFIEVHIFGGIHRRAIERVIGSSPKSRVDTVLLKRVERRLREVGATLEVI